MKKSTIILIAVIAIAAIWGISAYNGLVKMKTSQREFFQLPIYKRKRKP